MVASAALIPAEQALFASYSSVLGGAERILLDHAGAVDGAVIACPEGPLAEAARGLGLPHAPLRERGIELYGSARARVTAPARLAGHAREIGALVRRLRPRVLVAWGMRSLPACAALPGGPPLVFAHNDLLPSGAGAAVVRAAARRAARVVCLSRAIAEDLDPRWRLGERIEVVHAGVDLEQFAPPSGPGADALFLGALVEWKRPELALEAVARVPGLRLRVAGAPLDAAGEWLLVRMRGRAGHPDLAGRVRIEGGSVDPRSALRDAGCLLHCADREPYGLALVEALACGVPVVAPDGGGPREIVDPTCGELYPTGDAEAAAGALARVLADPALRTGARRRAEERFDLAQAHRRFNAVLEGVA